MTAYIVLFFTILLFALLGLRSKKLDNYLFLIEMIILTFFLCFRYGQGSDYHNYENIFMEQVHSSGISYNKEEVFALLNYFFARMNCNYTTFVGAIGLICMAFTFRGILKLSSVKTVSVFLLFPTYYLTYYFSAIREGIALSIALGVIIPLVLEGKKKKAFIFIVFVSLIHQSSIVMLVMLLDYPWHKMRKFFLLFSSTSGMALWAILQFVGVNIHELVFSPSYTALIIRLVLFAIITILFEKSEYSNKVNKLYDIYFIGLCLYLCTFAAALFSQRGTAYFKISEIILVPNMMMRVLPVSVADCRNSMRKTLFAFMTMICILEGIKNLASYPNQMGYPAQVTFYNYPYISIFDKGQEKLYRDGE